MEKKEDAAIRLIHTLMCRKDIHIFLDSLNRYYQSEYTCIIDTVNNVQYLCDGAVIADKDDIVQRITHLEDTEDAIVHQIYHRSSNIGYLVIKNSKLNDNKYMVQTISDFVASYLLEQSSMQKLNKEATTDKLTELYNRNEYIKKFKELKEFTPDKLGIIFIDINSLKEINDNHGHAYGDNIIKNTASAIKKITGETVYRFGGDEFIAIIPNIDKNDFSSMICELYKSFENAQDYSVSIGESYRDNDVNIDEQIQQADSLMYKQKKQYYESLNNNRRKKIRNIQRFLLL